LKVVINLSCLVVLLIFLLCSIVKCCKKAKQVCSCSLLWIWLLHFAFTAFSWFSLLYAPSSPFVSFQLPASSFLSSSFQLLQLLQLPRLPEALLIVLSFASRAIAGLTFFNLAALTLKRSTAAVTCVCVPVVLLLAFQVLAYAVVFKILSLPLLEDYQVWLEIAGNVAQIFIGAAFLRLLYIKLEERDVSNTTREETSSPLEDPLLDLEKGVVSNEWGEKLVEFSIGGSSPLHVPDEGEVSNTGSEERRKRGSQDSEC